MSSNLRSDQLNQNVVNVHHNDLWIYYIFAVFLNMTITNYLSSPSKIMVKYKYTKSFYRKVCLFMRYYFDFLLAVVLTSLSYFVGSCLFSNGLSLLHAFIIGSAVVLLGAVTEALKAPIWLIILVPFPIGMIILFLFLDEPVQIWFITYLMTLAFYSVIHVFLSFFFKFHSLIPAWKLSK